MKKARLFLADDHAILREGLVHILSKVPEYDVIGESGDGKEALDRIEKLKPDLAILDVSMPTMTGIEISREIKRYNPGVKILILTQHDNEAYVKQLLKNGIDGYILKENASDELLKAVEVILKGKSYLSPEITKKIVSGFSEDNGTREDERSPFTVLSNRERVILKLIAEGKSNREIASTFFISDQTVKTHRANIMKKLDIHKLADLVKYAIKCGIA